MKVFILSLAVLTGVFGFSIKAHADLNLIGQGTSAHGTYNLIYDTDLDITWYDFTHTEGEWWLDTWWAQMDWAEALTVDFGDTVYEDWRLPSTFNLDCWGYDCTNSEMGHLYYTELGNSAGGPFTNTGPFENLFGNWYWSSRSVGNNYAVQFKFSLGWQIWQYTKAEGFYAIAVHSGKLVPAMPDLIVTVLSAPSTGTAGGSIYVSNSVRNEGDQTAPASKSGFYLSVNTNSSIGPSDIFIGSRDVPKSTTPPPCPWRWCSSGGESLAAGLAPGETSGDNTKLTISSNTSAGTYYIKAKADYQDIVSETDEDNNIMVSGAITITAAGLPPWRRR